MDFAASQKFLSRELCGTVKKMIDDPVGWQKDKNNWRQFKQIAAQEKNLVFDSSFKKIWVGMI